ncbi:class II aldolase/adducin family protein [Gordonia sp. CPCC 205333]|uniref:class II aldolase/adducin family protein n=1 Tax=Gordonia sp. CPCC 205333 TaxID=3140790 RepID=UPI003AF37BD0
MSALDAAAAAVATAARLLGAEGLVIGSAGNISVRVGELVAITATGIELAKADPSAITIVDLAGNTIAGTYAPTSEIELHLGVYRRELANAVVHTHSPEATAVSVVLEELPCLHYQQLALGGAVPVIPFAPFGSDELAASVLAALAHKRAVLMANHGAVTVGSDLADAMDKTLLLEWACGLYRRAKQVGEPRALTTAEQQAVIDTAITRGYGQTHRATSHTHDNSSPNQQER